MRTRLVVYLSGFDPRGARHYHQLYRREAEKQAAVTGQQTDVGARERIGEHLVGWQIRSGETTTDYRYFEWDDIVRDHWPRRPLAIGWTTLRSGFQMLGVGAFKRTFQWSWPAGVTAMLPFAALIHLLAIALAIIVAGYAIGGTTGLLAGTALAVALLSLGAWLERKFNIAWISRVVNFHFVDGAGKAPDLAERLHDLADDVDPTGYDEVLIVGHSYGTSLAISFVARLLERHPTQRLSLLTLGQTTPWLTFHPKADAMRADIAAVATSERVDWIDVSAPPDGACFALVDPYTVVGDRDADRANPKLLNAKFHESMAGTAFAKSTRDWMQLHFQYLMATAHRAEYDYFAITAGDRALADRFAHRPSVRDFTRLRAKSMKAVR
ncbi:hypothetical protein [Sphingomicrobium clamense]|uniref:Uncharacterized protein n=1 Tax=Sphingomicrobium clamense TaxID=2851013 RepID=A0ABS6V894_9SPHN|nr:hypothetical protein [Sphingomicrobium sp. B8]MBW0145806.1 hypothetical protein [Sphingomicrobium sp. B8]